MKYSNGKKPIECMMTQSTCYKGTTTMTPKGVLWHSTGANNPNLKRYVQPDDDAPNRAELIELIGKNTYKNDWNHVKVQAGLNAWIGKLADGTVAAVQTMPWNYKPWGCGSGSKGSCNNGWMQFEICEDGLSDKTYFNAVYNEACELTAYYCKMYNLDPRGTVKFQGVDVPVILDHSTSCKLGLGSNHGDVMHWFKKHGKTLDDIREDVAKLMGLSSSTTVSAPAKKEGEYEKGKQVKLATDFQSCEFDCQGKNCCSTTLVDKKLVDYLQKIRNHFGKAVNVSSGYRCAQHNNSIGGATNSYHMQGKAADIYINGVKPVEIARYAESIGVLGIGLYETNKDGHFVHIDTRTSKSYWYGQAEEKRTTFQEEIAPAQISVKEIYRVRKSWTDMVSQKGAYVNLQGAITCCEAAGEGYEVYNSKGEVVYKYGENKQQDQPKQEVFKPYVAKVTASLLNYRSGPGVNYSIKGQIKKDEAYTIVEEKDEWGKLKSGAGWVMLQHMKKI